MPTSPPVIRSARPAAVDADHAERLRRVAGDLPPCHASVRAAFEQGQFELAYQPILHLHSRRVVGCEALLRWNHPLRGPQPPSAFVPIVERSRLALELGDWVVEQASVALELWRQDGLGTLRLAVNVAPLQLLSPDFPARMERVLGRCGLDPERLSLEITQDVLLDRPEAAGAALMRLAALGLHVELDDFGGGPSMLSTLRALAVSGFKLDRRFLDGLSDARPGARNDLRVLAGLAQQFGLRAIAEGVQTEAELDALLEIGIEEAQGFLFSKPLPPEAFAAYLHARRAA